MAKELDKNEQFYEKYLTEPDRDIHAVITGLGLATFRVTNSKLLERLKVLCETEEVEAEFSFIRNKHLHYKPAYLSGVFSDGILTVRTLQSNGFSFIAQFIVHHTVFSNTVTFTSFGHDSPWLTVDISEDVDTNTTLETMALALAHLFK